MDAENDPGTAPEGQGQGEAQNGLYPDLSGVPDSIRESVLPLLKEYEGNVTRKFQEAADYRKQWEPFQEMGVHEMEPDDLKALLEFREVASDPDAFRDWYRTVGENEELFPKEAPAEPAADPQEQLSQLLKEALDERLGPIESVFQQQSEQQALQEAETFVNGKLDELQGEHGEFDRDAVCQLALAYDGDDAISRGFSDYQRLVGAAEKGVLQSKLDAPDTPEQGGRPASGAEPITTFDQAKLAARDMVRQAMSS